MTEQGMGAAASDGGRPEQDLGPGVAPFLLGAAAGGLAGVLAALLLSGPVRVLAATLARRFGRDDDDGLRFELLLQ